MAAILDVQAIPALSIRQPWAGLILGGWKPCENRTWTRPYRGPVIIHAGQKWDPPPSDIAEHLAVVGFSPETTPRGYLGVVDLVDIHPATDCDGLCDGWGETGDGVFHWVVQSPRPFATPVPGPGRLDLWRKDIPTAVHDRLRKVLTDAR